MGRPLGGERRGRAAEERQGEQRKYAPKSRPLGGEAAGKPLCQKMVI